MEPNEIARLVAELKISGVTEKKVVKAPAGNNGRADQLRLTKVVIGKIFDTRVVNRETLRMHIPRILQVRGGVEIEIVGDNLFAVRFGVEGDRRRALHDGPWHFFRNLRIFKEAVGLQHPADIIFDEYNIWIQLHNLSVTCMTPAMVREVGESVGRVLEIEVNEGGSCLGQFARVRVVRSVTEPLERCVKIEQEEGHEERVVLIRYERLPEFCSVCGCVGHPGRHCPDEEADRGVHGFGPWLRAGRVMDARRSRVGQAGRSQKENRKESSGGNMSVGLRLEPRQGRSWVREGGRGRRWWSG